MELSATTAPAPAPAPATAATQPYEPQATVDYGVDLARRTYARLHPEGDDGLGRVRATAHDGSRSWFNRITNGVHVGTGSEQATGPNGRLEVLETTVHEVTHKWMDDRAGFGGLFYAGPSGRLSEGLSQVMAGAAMVLEGTPEERAWGWKLIDPRGRTARMESEIPGRPPTFVPLSVTMEDVRRTGFTLKDNGYVHVHSGVIQAAHLEMAKAIGMEPMARITTDAARNGMHQFTGFNGWAKLTLAAAGRLHGEGSDEQAAVRRAWQSVQVLPAS